MTDLINRIEGISTVHRMLSDSEWMPLSLKKLSVKIIESASGVLPSGQSISAQIDCPSEVYIIPKQANSLAILLNELTTNTIKYALPHRKYISVHVTIARQPDGNISLQYRDDGPGFPEAVINKQGYSVGLFLLHNIVTSDLRGKVELSNNNGAVIDIYFRPLT
jgi:two-component sensor histidine kinase